MRYADVEKHCMAMKGVTLHQPWGYSRVFKIGGKMFAMIAYEEDGQPHGIWFKAGETSFAILTRIDGVAPCPIWRARSGWRWMG
jgi:predicted DNA-binding protein (MmcQ/YjbR family)